LHQSPLVCEAEIAKGRNELAVHRAAESAAAKREVEAHKEDEDCSATQKEGLYFPTGMSSFPSLHS